MTPELLIVGGVTQGDNADLEFAHSPGDEPAGSLRYVRSVEPPEESSYSGSVELRLSGVVRATERGWIATAPTLGALGYGDTPQAALDDLLDEIEQYLEFLRDDAPKLAPAIAHHAQYVHLLDVPRATWIASAVVDASPLE